MSIEELPTLEQIEREIENRPLENSLLAFMKWYFKNIYKTQFIENWHHKKLCEILERVHKGELTHLIINFAPRYSKTEIFVKAFIAWSLAKNFKSKFIHLSYSDDLALDNSSRIKEIISHEAFYDRWPIELKKDSKSKKKWYTQEGGGVYATSMGGAIIGFGAGGTDDDFCGAVIIDDPMKPLDAESGVMRKKINDSFNNTIKSRLNNPSKTPVIVIMQRLHEEDFTGFLMGKNTEFEWTNICIPAINENGPSEYDPRMEGEALWPRKHSVEQLDKMKERSLRSFSSQYQQQPAPAEGNIIKKRWIQFYKRVPILEREVQSWDFTFSGKETSDYVAGELWGNDGANHYALDMVRGKLNFPQSIAAMKTFSRKHPGALAKLVEIKANGQAVVDSLKDDISGIISISPKESKESRVNAISPLFEAGNVWLPDPSIFPEHKWWVDIFIAELCSFPYAKNDDTVDACSQYLNKYGIIISDEFSNDYSNQGTTIAGGTSNW